MQPHQLSAWQHHASMPLAHPIPGWAVCCKHGAVRFGCYGPTSIASAVGLAARQLSLCFGALVLSWPCLLFIGVLLAIVRTSCQPRSACPAGRCADIFCRLSPGLGQACAKLHARSLAIMSADKDMPRHLPAVAQIGVCLKLET